MLSAPNPNTRSPREAMGLESGYHDRWRGELQKRIISLEGLSQSYLAKLVENSSEAEASRFAAGVILALRGDPRIKLSNPTMVQFDAATVTIGLDYLDVDQVTAAWARFGVLRAWIAKECPRHRVFLPSFALAKYPVTNAEYLAFLNDTHDTCVPSSWCFGIFPCEKSNHPVWTVAPEAADRYARWLAEKTGRKFRLATEEEWEYAATAGTGREFPWGATFEKGRANTVEYGPLTTSPVGAYPAGASLHGILDLGGNVEEYTSSIYHPYPGGAFINDDLIVDGASYRVARGGSFTRYGDLARCRRRHGWYKGEIYAMGFRLAESI